MSEIADDLLAADDVIPTLGGWLASGDRAALVTLLAIDGPGPRALGAQMAIRADGTYAGYLSGGCLERSIVAEAQAAMKAGSNRRIRFGGDSGYFDLRLPCGAALELYVDQAIDARQVSALAAAAAARRLAYRTTDLVSGASEVAFADDGADSGSAPRREGDHFVRPHRPPPRLVVLGSSPLVVALARLARVTGFRLDVATPDERLAAMLASQGVAVHQLVAGRFPENVAPDAWTATIIAFHEHDSEPALIARLLELPGFYIGALGSRAVHQRRVADLRAMGLSEAAISRLSGSIGAIPGAKTQAALALGILTDVLAAARKRGFID